MSVPAVRAVFVDLDLTIFFFRIAAGDNSTTGRFTFCGDEDADLVCFFVVVDIPLVVSPLTIGLLFVPAFGDLERGERTSPPISLFIFSHSLYSKAK